MAKARQGHLPTMEPPSIKEIDRAAEKYLDLRDRRMALTQEEVKSRDVLELLMKKHELKTYNFDDYTVELAAVEKVKVKRQKSDEDEDEGDDEE